MAAVEGARSSVENNVTDTFAVPPGELPYGERMRRSLPALHRGFLSLNRYVALPVLRAGLAPFWCTPLGYFVLLRTRGRRSGAVREAPLGYVICDGAVYVVAGFGRRTHWFRNIEADPHVEVVLPGRSFSGIAEEVSDPDERLRGMRRLLIALGPVGTATTGCDARTATDEAVLQRTRGLPLVRIRPTGIAAGPFDPGGWAWVPYQLAVTWLSWRALRWIAARVRVR